MQIPGKRFEAGEVVYSDWFPRGGDNAVFRAELIDLGASLSNITITFYTKNSDDQGDPVDPIGGASPAIKIVFDPGTGSAAGDVDNEVVISEFQEMLRYKIACTGDWANIRIFEPVFFDDSVP